MYNLCSSQLRVFEHRKLDLLYFIHFSSALPLMLLVDLQVIYPPIIVPAFMIDLKAFYVETFDDRFFRTPPPFFQLFVWLEILYQAPVIAWSLGGLYRNSSKVPLVLLPYALVVFLTTLTCIVEYSFWDTLLYQKICLTALYGPYLALSALMASDMYLRLDKMINTKDTLRKKSRLE
ncbi:BgTH12-04868 [Blumeria graminis f. sp. triticale]|uniref:Efficient mitochondria targeting-associated protein 19 n=1 Tax=Blumeria graminis f. sp. triticale TaxID=1689686 RepID=A0A9W4CVG8_BLUGR|nr:BgTH12-04868 [Blumeria graminis f. sp. triticale]